MTTQEAIELLDDLVGMIEDNRNSDFDKAFKKAIEALKKQAGIERALERLKGELTTAADAACIFDSPEWEAKAEAFEKAIEIIKEEVG